MEILTVVLQVVLGLAFIGAGTSKLVGTQQMVDDFDRFGYPRWFMYVTGLIEVVAALGVLASIFIPFLAVFGGLLIAAVMVGAVSTHVRLTCSLWFGSPLLLVQQSGFKLLFDRED